MEKIKTNWKKISGTRLGAICGSATYFIFAAIRIMAAKR